MNFSKKRTCKGCLVSGEVICTVYKKDTGGELGIMLPKIPLEPCLKPTTNRDVFLFVHELQYFQNRELEIFRLK